MVISGVKWCIFRGVGAGGNIIYVFVSFCEKCSIFMSFFSHFLPFSGSGRFLGKSSLFDHFNCEFHF